MIIIIMILAPILVMLTPFILTIIKDNKFAKLNTRFTLITRFSKSDDRIQYITNKYKIGNCIFCIDESTFNEKINEIKQDKNYNFKLLSKYAFIYEER